MQIKNGEPSHHTAGQGLVLSRARKDAGVRPSRRVRPETDPDPVVPATGPQSVRRPPDSDDQRSLFPDFSPPQWARTVKKPLGAAVDLGTTHIRLSLVDLLSGRKLAGRAGPNPQAAMGADVMTRLNTACESPDKAGALRQKAVEAIGRALGEMAAREGIHPGRVVRIVLVGNTAMLALLSGVNYSLLVKPDYWGRPIDCLPRDTSAWAGAWAVHPGAEIRVVAPLAGFVGSDLLAGAVAADLIARKPGCVMMDFGTNSEIALWDGKRLWVTSAAGGPAFEGSGPGCGWPAGAGAVYRVEQENGRLLLSVLGGGGPRGICGSGMVDLMACLVRTERLNPVGRFGPDVPETGLVLAQNGRHLVVTKNDVDLFQRAKAAIATGLMVLMEKAGMTAKDIGAIHVGGAFGRFLNIGNAQRIGLLPGMDPGAIRLWGDLALAGCEMGLTSAGALSAMAHVRDHAKVINLSASRQFGDFFMENLYLQPIKGRG